MQRRDLLQGFIASFLGNSNTKLLTSSPNDPRSAFRKRGGQVAVFMYGGWENKGSSFNPSPWYWINRYAPDRLPEASVPIQGTIMSWTLAKTGPNSFICRSNSFNKDKENSWISTNTEKNVINIISEESPSNYSVGEFTGFTFRLEGQIESFLRAEIEITLYSIGHGIRKLRETQISRSTSQIEINVDFMKANDEFGNLYKSISSDVIINWSVKLIFCRASAVSMDPHISFFSTAEYENCLRSLRGLPSDHNKTSSLYLSLSGEAGIDAFLLCSYWKDGLSFNKNTIDSMLLSAEHTKTKVGLYFDTLASAPLVNISQVNSFADYLVSIFDKSSYWKINGRPVIGFHGGQSVIDFFGSCHDVPGSNPVDRCRNSISILRKRCLSMLSQYDDLIILTGNATNHPDLIGTYCGPALLEYIGFDAGTAYNQFVSYRNSDIGCVPQDSGRLRSTGTAISRWPEKLGSLTYDGIQIVYREVANWISRSPRSRLSYFVPAIVGWNPAPWLHKEVRVDNPCSSHGGCAPSVSQFANHITWARDFSLNKSSAPNTPPVVCIYAWDEFGEGGFLCPTKNQSFDKLRIMRAVFGDGMQ